MRRVILLLAASAALASPTALAQAAFPRTIPLPSGWAPEGIAIGRGTTFYAGSLASGAVFRGDLRTGRGRVLVPAASGRSAVGLAFARGRLFVAGGATGKAFVYDARTGALVGEYELAGQPTFVNDVVVTRDAAYFTDSMRAVVYRIGLSQGGRPAVAAEVLPLTGDFQLVPGFNLNGIEATPNGKTLVAVQTVTGKLFSIDPTSGATREIGLGGATVVFGDGLLLHGRTLYVVQNFLNRIAVVRLAPNLARGAVVRTIEDPAFDVPTTIDRLGRRLYAVNARFSTPPTPSTPYEIVRVRR
jgi:sugar lactone lactonase YvrE